MTKKCSLTDKRYHKNSRQKFCNTKGMLKTLKTVFLRVYTSFTLGPHKSLLRKLHYWFPTLRGATSTNKAYLSSPKRTRQEEASSLLQYLQPFAMRHGKSIISASTCTNHIWILNSPILPRQTYKLKERMVAYIVWA